MDRRQAERRVGRQDVAHLPSGRAVTIGSQNLTSRGMGNREASVLITDPALVGQAETEAIAWLRDRVLITPAMIEELSKQLPRLKKLFQAAKDAAGLLDEQIQQ